MLFICHLLAICVEESDNTTFSDIIDFDLEHQKKSVDRDVGDSLFNHRLRSAVPRGVPFPSGMSSPGTQ